MKSGADAAFGARRITLLVATGVAGGIAFSVGEVVPDLWGLLPRFIRHHSLAWAAFILASGCDVARRSSSERVSRAIDRVDRVATSSLRGGFSAILVALLAIGIVTWLPPYLTWPWHRDADTFAVLAWSWDGGVLPYRDIRAYNFPGHTYLHWLIGKIFGWGFTPALYAADAAGLIGLCVALAAWSRRRFKSALPGLVSALIFAAFSMNLGYEFAAERDGHTALLMALALLVAEGWPGMAGWLTSAVFSAIALTIRPHAILFFPVLAVAVGSGRPDRGISGRKALLIWGSALLGFSAIGFAPLFVAGIADDLIHGLRIATYGGPYSRTTPATFLASLLGQFRDGKVVAILAANIAIAALARGNPRRSAVLWSLALAAAIVYKPLHPLQHAYLIEPLALFAAIGVAPPTAWLLERPRIGAHWKVFAVLAGLSELVAGIPGHCRPRDCLPAVAALARGRFVDREPSGCRPWFSGSSGRPYDWRDYVDLIDYLRKRTGPRTSVANVLKEPPFPAINGPSGRDSPFRAESGICWMWLVDVDLDAEFASQLERAGDSVVVWAPIEIGTQPRLRLPRVGEVILRRYRFEARFGRMEVWRRNVPPETSGPAESVGR